MVLGFCIHSGLVNEIHVVHDHPLNNLYIMVIELTSHRPFNIDSLFSTIRATYQRPISLRLWVKIYVYPENQEDVSFFGSCRQFVIYKHATYKLICQEI